MCIGGGKTYGEAANRMADYIDRLTRKISAYSSAAPSCSPLVNPSARIPSGSWPDSPMPR